MWYVLGNCSRKDVLEKIIKIDRVMGWNGKMGKREGEVEWMVKKVFIVNALHGIKKQ